MPTTPPPVSKRPPPQQTVVGRATITRQSARVSAARLSAARLPTPRWTAHGPSPEIDRDGTPPPDDRDRLAFFHGRRNRKGIVRKLVRWVVVKQPSWLVSLCLHSVLFVVLSSLFFPMQIREELTLELGSFAADDFALDTLELGPIDAGEFDLVEPEMIMPVSDPIMELEPIDLMDTSVDTLASWMSSQDHSDEIRLPGVPGGVAGRGVRREHAIGLGATKGSEEAVDRALKWLAAHQNDDGSWSFDLHSGRCRGRCTHSGSGSRAKNGATALALLPFLGAGHSQDSGKYRDKVARGLSYLLSRQASNGSFHEPQGTMYSHGLASLALCEAVAMADMVRDSSKTRRLNQKLRPAAQEAINFIIQSQHRQGGWRYEPGQRGDLSVVGWQAMALQSGRLGGLRVPEKTFHSVTRFLNSVSSDHYGSTYGYLNATPRPGTTAIGLLCRMYLGWDKTHPGIANGAEYLGQTGPSSNNVYFDYYATQVMHHYQGPLWERWNSILRKHLVRTQVKRGHESGSWFFEDDFGSGIGGRLYITAMSAMTLEVYYRHMAIYSQNAVAVGDGEKRQQAN